MYLPGGLPWLLGGAVAPAVGEEYGDGQRGVEASGDDGGSGRVGGKVSSGRCWCT